MEFIRNLGYEFFKITHFLAAALFVVVFLWHCDAILTSWYIYTVLSRSVLLLVLILFQALFYRYRRNLRAMLYVSMATNTF